MGVVVITGTGTDVGKTVVTAALVASALGANRAPAVLKPVQTGVEPGQPGDVDDVRRLTGPVTVRELARYPDPLAPATAAIRSGLPETRPAEIIAAAAELARDHDPVFIEGAGGLLVRFDSTGTTLADVAIALAAPVVIVARAGLGTLNETALTSEALRARALTCLGVVIGEWPVEPDLAARHNLVDLSEAAGAPLLGVLPAGSGALSVSDFVRRAPDWLHPDLGGRAIDPAAGLLTTVGDRR